MTMNNKHTTKRLNQPKTRAKIKRFKKLNNFKKLKVHKIHR